MTTEDRHRAQIDQQEREIMELRVKLAQAETRIARQQRMIDHLRRQQSRTLAETVFGDG